MLLVYSISTHVQVLKNLNIEHCLPSVYSISTYVQDLRNETIYTVALSMLNINLRSRSEELNYIHGCSQYVQYQPTFKICGTKLYTSAYPQDIQYQPTLKIWCTKLFTRSALYIQYQPTFKIWGAKQYTSAYHQYIQYQPYVQDLKNKTNYTVALSMFNINLRSRSAEFIYTPLLTLSIFSISPRSISDVLNYLLGLPSIFNINLRSRSEEQNYLHGCSQYVQY